MSDLINKPLGKYRLVTRLGGGGMAEVYKAYHPGLYSFVAIKTLHSHLAGKADFIERFQSEATVVASLHHPNIVHVYDFDRVDDIYYMVMELIEGPTLKTELREYQAEGRLFTLVEIDRIFGELASAIDYAHARGLVHRDLKPANIMFTAERRVVLTDFGIARIREAIGHTITGTVVGTPAYMSPEQAQGEQTGARSDIYSLGVILYELVTGRVPFVANNDLALLNKHASEPPPLPTTVNPNVPEAVERVICQALSKNPADRYQRATEMALALEEAIGTLDRQTQVSKLISTPTFAPTEAIAPDHPQRTRIFISYKRDVDPDESVAQQVFEALSHQYDVFIDQTLLVGAPWAKRIEAELRQCDFLIVFLSAESIHSDMVLAEIELAHRLAQEQGGRPAILPVRMAYREPFRYPLSIYLDPINWAFWQNNEDTPRLIAELRQAIFGGDLSIDDQVKADLLQASEPSPLPTPLALAQPVHLEPPEGTMDPQSVFYVERPGDLIALEAIKRQGVTITIKAPRQMGKSSLLMRIISAAARVDKRVAFLDFQLLDKLALTDADTFFRQFCIWLTDELEMDDRVDEYWKLPLGNSQRCTRYMHRYLLKELGTPLLLAMDEVESIFDTDFRSNFFGMLRSWHNKRLAGSIWKQLDLALVTSTEPYRFIEDLNQSPFNVGEVIELPDFTPEQVAGLNRRYNQPLSPDQQQQLMEQVGGHPYLVRRALYLVASQRISPTDIFAHAADDRGPFGDHLRYHLFQLQGKENLIQGLREVLHLKTCQDERIFFRLHGAGLVHREGRVVLPRCQLYADFFREYLFD
jgi:serine/threonine protein kinase